MLGHSQTKIRRTVCQRYSCMRVLNPKFEYTDGQYRHQRDILHCHVNLRAMSLSASKWLIRAGERAILSTLEVGNLETSRLVRTQISDESAQVDRIKLGSIMIPWIKDDDGQAIGCQEHYHRRWRTHVWKATFPIKTSFLSADEIKILIL